MQEKIDISIKNFYVFNPSFGTKEGEEDKKILFYYPPKTEIITQIKTVGLSEAIIKFTQSFITQGECKSVHTLKTRQYFFEAEPDYWIILTINVPYTISKHGIKDVIYHSETVHDEVYSAVLKQSYEMYKLFVGPFHSLITDSDASNLKLKLHQFFNRYLHCLNISSCDVIDVFEGMQFLPLDKRTYLHAQSFMNHFQCEFYDEVQYSLLLVRNHVVWSNIDSADLRVIYRYLTTNLLASHVPENANKINTTGESSSTEITMNNEANVGRFLTCPAFYTNNNVTTAKVPKLFIKTEGENKVYQLVVYNVMSSFLCLFIPENIELSVELMKSIETFLKLKLMVLASELSLNKEKRRSIKSNISNSGAPFSYIYFNRLNLAQKNTLRDFKATLPPEVLSVLTNVCFDKKRNSPTCETIVKTYDDYWVVGQFCNEREFFVVTQQKNSTLIEISDEMRRICDKQLKSIFFHV